MTARFLLPILTLAALAVGTPQTAFAQDTNGLSSMALTISGVSLAGIGLYVVSSRGDGQRSVAAMQYLRLNALQVRQDICLGRGPVVDEMAAEMRLARAQGRVLGHSLRTQRRDLLALANPSLLTPDRAWQFFDAVRRMGEQTRSTQTRKAG